MIMLKKELIIAFFLILVPVVLAGECCDDISSITIVYVGTQQIQQGDTVDVYKSNGGPGDLIHSGLIPNSQGKVIFHYPKKETQTWFKLIRNGQAIAEGNFHTSCSKTPGPYDTTNIEKNEDSITDWKIITAEFENAKSQECKDIECGTSDQDLDTIGDFCDNCPGTPNKDQKDSDRDGTGDVCEEEGDIPEFTLPGVLAIIGLTVIIGAGYLRKR